MAESWLNFEMLAKIAIFLAEYKIYLKFSLKIHILYHFSTKFSNFSLMIIFKLNFVSVFPVENM